MNTLDAIDRKILSLLQTDSRMTMQELSEKVGLSVSPCHRRVRLLEERGVITRYMALVDQKSLGLHVSVFISIKLQRQKEEDLNRFARAISKWEEVLECYLMTGNRDYLLRVVAADLSSYEAFLKNKLTRRDGNLRVVTGIAVHDPAIMRDRLRTADQVALHFIAAFLGEEGELRRSFDALGDHRQLERAAEAEDGLHDGGGLGVGAELGDE